MVPITDQDGAAKAKYELERALLDGERRQLFAGEALITALSHENFELSVEWGKLIFAWWDVGHSENWRVIGYEIEPGKVILQVSRNVTGETAILVIRDQRRWEANRELGG